MVADEPNMLTTGQAAKLCSVTPDTVLKWIKKGKLSGVRTVGGHYRIERGELEKLGVLGDCVQTRSQQLPECYDEDIRCWEYLSGSAGASEKCRQCVVYRVRATRCYLLAGMEEDVGHALQHCHGSCEDCAYYRWVNSLATNVMVITADDVLIQKLTGEPDDRIFLRFARSAYEASAIIESFRAAFVIIDRDSISTKKRELVDCIARDSRLPGTKIILCTQHDADDASHPDIGSTDVWSVIEKPFGLQQIAVEIAEKNPLARREHHASGRFQRHAC